MKIGGVSSSLLFLLNLSRFDTFYWLQKKETKEKGPCLTHGPPCCKIALTRNNPRKVVKTYIESP